MHALFPLLAFMKSDCYNNRSIWKLQELYFIPTITGDYNNEEIKTIPVYFCPAASCDCDSVSRNLLCHGTFPADRERLVLCHRQRGVPRYCGRRLFPVEFPALQHRRTVNLQCHVDRRVRPVVLLPVRRQLPPRSAPDVSSRCNRGHRHADAGHTVSDDLYHELCRGALSALDGCI